MGLAEQAKILVAEAEENNLRLTVASVERVACVSKSVTASCSAGAGWACWRTSWGGRRLGSARAMMQLGNGLAG